MENTHNIEDNLSKEQKEDLILERQVMPILCDEVSRIIDKMDSEFVLTIEHLPNYPISVILTRKTADLSTVSKPLINKSPKKPKNFGKKWTKVHLTKLKAFCDENDKLDIIAKNLCRNSNAVLGKLQQLAKTEMWAYNYLVASFLPIKYYSK